ncbi:MAG TPA: zinc ribbon domain-containing protein [Actinomycetota bacterium]|nr:zinc ribbon domain-containing protein [Actinomycetota bacterium]
MPVYEYACVHCDASFERLRRMGEPEPACPNCGADEVRRRLSVFATGRSAGASSGGGCACGGACACGA